MWGRGWAWQKPPLNRWHLGRSHPLKALAPHAGQAARWPGCAAPTWLLGAHQPLQVECALGGVHGAGDSCIGPRVGTVGTGPTWRGEQERGMELRVRISAVLGGLWHCGLRAAKEAWEGISTPGVSHR